MPHLENREMRLSLPLQLLLIFLVSTVLMVLLRDVRTPLDGSSYALGVQRLAVGNFEDVFRWSHALHVPVLFVGYRLVSTVVQVDVLTYYQVLNILLGAGGLCLIYLLVRRNSRRAVDAVLACLLVMFSWVYWVESVTADEKMLGYFFVLIYLNLLDRFLGGDPQEDRSPGAIQAVALAFILSLSILLHASAVLVVPVSVFLVVRRKAFRFGVITALVSVSLILVAYAVILNLLGSTGWEEVAAYFSSGVSRYSVAATGISGVAWVRSVVQGLTKLLWAVFSEDGIRTGLFLVGLNTLFLAGVLWMMWRHRRDQMLQGFMVLLVTAGIFGMTYAPDSPDSYFLMLVPVAVFFAKALEIKKFRYAGLVLLAILIANNGAHYLGFSAFRDEGVDKRYQESIGQRLSGGDVLVVLDADMGMKAGTQAIIPIHAYFNPELEHIPGTDFFADPSSARFLALAREGRLFIEGLCFEDFDNRNDSEISKAGSFLVLAEVYDFEQVVRFAEYSSLYHRSYKHVFRLTAKSTP